MTAPDLRERLTGLVLAYERTLTLASMTGDSWDVHARGKARIALMEALDSLAAAPEPAPAVGVNIRALIKGAIEQASDGMHNSQLWHDEGQWDAYIDPMIQQVERALTPPLDVTGPVGVTQHQRKALDIAVMDAEDRGDDLSHHALSGILARCVAVDGGAQG